jgi:hypothetical protein
MRFRDVLTLAVAFGAVAVLAQQNATLAKQRATIDIQSASLKAASDGTDVAERRERFAIRRLNGVLRAQYRDCPAQQATIQVRVTRSLEELVDPEDRPRLTLRPAIPDGQKTTKPAPRQRQPPASKGA